MTHIFRGGGGGADTIKYDQGPKGLAEWYEGVEVGEDTGGSVDMGDGHGLVLSAL